jgi:hypothetical protein
MENRTPRYCRVSRGVCDVNGDDQFSPERCNPDIKRLAYADSLSMNGHPKNSIVSEHECNRFGIMFSMHNRLMQIRYTDTKGYLGEPGKVYQSQGLPLCMGAVDRIWDTRPSVNGTFAGWIISIAKAGNVIVSSVGSSPSLATGQDANKPGMGARLLSFVRGTRAE